MSSSKSQSPPLNYGSPCAACKFLRRKCLPDCIFAPHFPADKPQKFEIVHKIYGASNVSKILNQLSYDQRGEAAKSLVYEAEARLNEPVYGCVGFITILQERLRQLQTQLSVAHAELSTYSGSGTQAANVPVGHVSGPGSSSSSSMSQQFLAPPWRVGTAQSSLSEQILMQSPQQSTVDTRQLSSQRFATSYDRFNTSDQVQSHVVGQMSNVRCYEQQLQRESFGPQQSTTAEQQPPTTTALPPRAQ